MRVFEYTTIFSQIDGYPKKMCFTTLDQTLLKAMSPKTAAAALRNPFLTMGMVYKNPVFNGTFVIST